jgi:hypothetical protein
LCSGFSLHTIAPSCALLSWPVSSELFNVPDPFRQGTPADSQATASPYVMNRRHTVYLSSYKPEHVRVRHLKHARRLLDGQDLVGVDANSLRLLIQRHSVMGSQPKSLLLVALHPLVEPVPPDELSAAHGDVGEPWNAWDLAGENVGHVSFGAT